MKLNPVGVIFSGLVGGAVLLILGMLFGFVTMDWYTGDIWKPMTTTSIIWTVLFSLAFGVIFAAIYGLIHGSIAGSAAVKGMVFGLLIWLMTLWGLFMTFVYMKISVFLIGIWAVQGLITFLIFGLVVAAIYRE